MLVTVYITSHNRENSLKRAIESVLNQTYSPIEIIVIDDASTQFKISEFIVRNNLVEKVKFHRNENSRGANFSRNLALSMASGQFITGLDDDDYFHPKRVEIMLSALNKGKYSAISSLSAYEPPSGPTHLTHIKTFIKDLLIPNRKVEYDDMKVCNYLSNQILTETELLKSIGGFDENAPSLQDYETWYRLVKEHGPAFKIGKVLYHCATSQQSTTKKSGRKLEGHNYFIKKHFNDFDSIDLKSFEISKEYKKFGRVNLITIFKNLTKKNLSRALYLLIFKSYLIQKKKKKKKK